jgi:hypothetical protein
VVSACLRSTARRNEREWTTAAMAEVITVTAACGHEHLYRDGPEEAGTTKGHSGASFEHGGAQADIANAKQLGNRFSELATVGK